MLAFVLMQILFALADGGSAGWLWEILGFVAFAILLGGLGLAIVGPLADRPRQPSKGLGRVPTPVAHTSDGRPIYPVVGYTSDGSPITADKAVGYRQPAPPTNPLAIVALIMAFVFPIVAVVLGHVSRAQIRRTGEGGYGLAVAGLVLGYIGVAATLVAIMVVVVATRV
ncbi:DUF4190 domain-containing protein [Mycolicibacterium sp.]|uniref:DUF4190 domain-containing protein n=1 Tax=Mycolicibacterium sp. TaxID=2320850 RepID=UPI0037C5B03B